MVCGLQFRVHPRIQFIRQNHPEELWMPSSPYNDCKALEEAFVAQWANFGQAPGGAYHEDGELTWTEAPVAHLPYNAVIRTQLTGDTDDRINGMLRHFKSRGVQFLWMVHPFSRPADLEKRLVEHGLQLAGRETGMCLDLEDWHRSEDDPTGPITCLEVKDEETLKDFEDLIAEYWGLPQETHAYVDGFTRWAFRMGNRGVWLLAYQNSKAVAKAYLSIQGPDDTASIWGVYVKPEARGYGIATTLTALALRRAAELGKRRVVLAASQMARNLYRRIGFKESCVLLVYASAALPVPLQGLQPL